MTSTLSIATINYFEVIFVQFLTPVSQPITPSRQRAHQTVTFSGCNGHSSIEDSQNPKYNNFVSNISTESEMYFNAEENFVPKIAVHRPSPFLS